MMTSKKYRVMAMVKTSMTTFKSKSGQDSLLCRDY
jgi:hypothetical protein